MKIRTISFMLPVVILLTMLMSCATQIGCISSVPFMNDSIQHRVKLTDSITSIINTSENILCQLITLNPIDTTRVDSVKSVPCDLNPVIRFLLSDPRNFMSNEIVYGNFSPTVEYVFTSKKGQKICLALDFGLRKWRLLNVNKEILASADMKANNLQFLRVTRIIFPKDSTLEILNDNIISEQNHE